MSTLAIEIQDDLLGRILYAITLSLTCMMNMDIVVYTRVTLKRTFIKDQYEIM